MKPHTRIPVIGLLTLLSGCYAANFVEYEALKPAELAVSKSIKSLVVVSKCDLDTAYKFSAIQEGKLKDFNRDSMMMKQAVLGCADAMVESPRFDIYNPLITRTLTGSYTDTDVRIPWYKVREIAGTKPYDAVLSLEYGSFRDTIKYNADEGWLSGYQYVVVVKSLWRMYRLSDFQVADFAYTDTIAFDIDSPTEFLASLSMGPDFLKSALYEVGGITARRLAPYWTTMRRYYFGFGPMAFQDAAAYLTEGKWQKAADLLRPYTESDKKFIARNASFNMALTCEIANNMSAALEWVATAEKLGVDPLYIKEYRAILKKRKAEVEKLDQQMK